MNERGFSEVEPVALNLLDFRYSGYSDRFRIEEAANYCARLLVNFLGIEEGATRIVIERNTTDLAPHPSIYHAFASSGDMPVRMIPINLEPKITNFPLDRLPRDDGRTWACGATILRRSAEVLYYGLKMPLHVR